MQLCLLENEIKDLFGIEFENLLIDYEGKFMITEELESPMRKKPAVKVKESKKALGKRTIGSVWSTASCFAGTSAA